MQLSLQGIREEASFLCFFEKLKVSKQKLEIDDLELPSERKISSHYEEGEAPVEFVSTVEEHYRQNLFHQKYYFETLQTMEELLLKALREEGFGPEL